MQNRFRTRSTRHRGDSKAPSDKVSSGPTPGGSETRLENLPWLYSARAVRSFTTAFLTVIFPLYLAYSYNSSTAIGGILTAGSVMGGFLVAGVGLSADRFGRRPVLMALGLLGAAGSLALAGSVSTIVVIAAYGLGGIGRGGGAGSGGAYGPFFPAEQPMIATSVPPEGRTHAYGRLGFIGVLAAAAGSLAASSLDVFRHLGISTADAYKLMFVFGAACSVVVSLLCLPLRETLPTKKSPPPNEAPAPSGASGDGTKIDAGDQKAGFTTRQLLGRLGLTNALNGFGFGFLGPLLIYWFHVRFGVGSTEMGVLYTIVNLAGAIPYLTAHRLTNRLGAVKTVVTTRSLAVLLLLSMALAPVFIVAAILLGLRTVFTNLGMPARQAYTMGVADERRRGTVAAFSSLPAMATSSISPIVGGALMNVFVDVPIVGAAFFMAANTITYYLAFRKVPMPGE